MAWESGTKSICLNMKAGEAGNDVTAQEVKQNKGEEYPQSREKWTHFLRAYFALLRPSRYWMMPSCLGDNGLNPLIFFFANFIE